MIRIREVIASQTPPAEPLADIAAATGAIAHNLGLPVADLVEHREWCLAQHRNVWDEVKNVNDAIRHKFWKKIRTTEVGDNYRNATMEALRATKEVLLQALEGLARRINGVDQVYQTVGKSALQQPAAAGSIAGVP